MQSVLFPVGCSTESWEVQEKINNQWYPSLIHKQARQWWKHPFLPFCNSICQSEREEGRKDGEQQKKRYSKRGQGLPNKWFDCWIGPLWCNDAAVVLSLPLLPTVLSHKHTHTDTHTLVILDQPLCSFGQSPGCPSSPITVAIELHPDSLQIGSVTLNTGAHAQLQTYTSVQNLHMK